MVALNEFDFKRIHSCCLLVLLELLLLLPLYNEVVAVLSQVSSLLSLDVFEELLQILLDLMLLLVVDCLLKALRDVAS